MAEEVIKTIENVDKLFSQIVVNGEVHNSSNYVPPAQLQGNASRNSAGSRNIVQGEDVYGVNLNNILHNFSDRTVAEALAEEASARQLADEVIRSNIENINDKIPSSATASNKLVDNASMTSAINVVQAGLSDLEALIPAQASANNKLADKAFVNSSIATNTANFLGTYNSLSDIQAIQNPTNNDYAFLQTTDSTGNRQYDRYKFSSSDNQWHYEYTLNNSSFTSEQWATINSGLTQASVNQAIASACAYCASSNTNVTGASLYTGATLKILFTAQIAGADTSSALTITYNNSPYTVKVAKDGSLIDFTAKASGNAFVYCQAYTTLELMFDGTNFIIIGNPVVISNSDYSIMADGSITYTKTKVDDDFQHLCYIRVHGATQINLETFLSYAKKTGMNGLKITYYNLGNDATKYTIVYVTKYNDSWHLLEFSPSVYDFLISGNNLQCQALYPEQSDWTIEFWSGRNY